MEPKEVNSKTLEQAIDEVFAKLKAMPMAEFRALLEKHTGGDIACSLYYAWNPEYRPSLPEGCKHRWADSHTTPTGSRCMDCGLDEDGKP